MQKQSMLLRTFLKRHQKENSSLLFWSSNLVDYCKGRVVHFDGQYVLLRDCDEETERPYELLLRLDNVAAIYPCLEQKEADDRFKRIMRGFSRPNDKKPR